MPAPLSIVVESWRHIAHSYALVNQYQCLALSRMPGVRLYHKDLPFFGAHWRVCKGLFSAEDEALLDAIPSPPSGLEPDLVLRVAYPYDFTPIASGQLAVFGTAEYRTCPPGSVMGAKSGNLREALEGSGAILITPSLWSKEGFLNSGAPEKQVRVVPHGVDTAQFHPPTQEQRVRSRVALGMNPEEYVFLNVGSLSPNKGSSLLIKAFLRVLEQEPRARLLIKFNGALYSPKPFLEQLAKDYTPQQQAKLAAKVTLLGEQHSLTQMASLFHAADAYVSPYLAEAFNLPCLEACACGLPVLCTEGGPTDEFLPAEVRQTIRSKRQSSIREGTRMEFLAPDIGDLTRKMIHLVQDSEARKLAREYGPRHAQRSLSWTAVCQTLLRQLNLCPKETPSA